MRRIYLIAAGIAVTAAAYLGLSPKSPSQKSDDGKPKGYGPIFAPLEPRVIDAQTAARHKGAAEVIRQAFLAEMGREGTDAEIQYATAIANIESSYGRGWKGAMVGSNNWGAVQCAANAQTAAGCIPYQDSFSTGQKYNIAFRSYPTPVDGARDVIKHIFKKRPRTAAALSEDAPCVFRASLAMRRESYYGGFCPKATNRYGATSIIAKENRNPVSEAALACEREASELHAKRVATLLQEIAPAAGLAPMALCTYEDAVKWYKLAGPAAVSGPVLLTDGSDLFAPLSIFDHPTDLREPLSWV